MWLINIESWMSGRRGWRFAKTCIGLHLNFPKDELYGMISQMRRSAVSIPSNIAEGFGRRHANEFKQYISIAKGLLNELSTQTELAGRIDYLNKEKAAELLEKWTIWAECSQIFIKR